MPNPTIDSIDVNGTTYDIKDASAVETVTVNGMTYLPLSGDVDLGTIGGSSYTAGTGISIASDVISNTAPIWHGNDTGTFTTPINADQLEGYTVNTLLKLIYPVGSVYLNINNTNPSTFITGTTWELISSVALASEHVFGNEYNLAITDNTGNSALTLTTVYQSNKAFSYRHGSYGVKIPLANGTSGSGTFGTGGGLGLPTKAQHNGHPEYSGIIADTITLYTWKRTV